MAAIICPLLLIYQLTSTTGDGARDRGRGVGTLLVQGVMRTQMNAKDFSRLFGGFSTEKRVKLIKALLEAGPAGLSLLDLSRKTELSVIDIGITAEALLLIDLIDIAIKGENKVLTANTELIQSLFEKAYDAFGSGRDKPQALEPASLPDTADAETGDTETGDAETETGAK